mmetsp:Transcript_13799/g.35456  ORF Transcript_13799/g.35456 Transcript_13799/m.35456 type:complete len:388 (+) Transcript_13799:348-1511(+)
MAPRHRAGCTSGRNAGYLGALLVRAALEGELLLAHQPAQEGGHLVGALVEAGDEHLEHVVDHGGRQLLVVGEHAEHKALVHRHVRRRLLLRRRRPRLLLHRRRRRAVRRRRVVLRRGVHGRPRAGAALHQHARVDPEERLAPQHRRRQPQRLRQLRRAPPLLLLELQQDGRQQGGHAELQRGVAHLHLQVGHAVLQPKNQLPRRLQAVVPVRKCIGHLLNGRRQVHLLVFEGRPEEGGQNAGVEDGEVGWCLARIAGERRVHRQPLDVGVDAFRVGDVLQHHLAAVQVGVAEAQLEQLQRADLALRIVVRLREQLLREHGSVLVDEQLLAAVDTDEHVDDVVGTPAARAPRRVRLHGVRLPVVHRRQHRLVGLALLAVAVGARLATL